MSGPLETNRLWDIVRLVVLSILGGTNVFLSLFIVPKFEQVFLDALGSNYPLPALTRIVIMGRIPLALIVGAWLVAGIVATWKRHRTAMGIVALGDLFFLVLMGLTLLALFMPMAVEHVGMSDAGSGNAAASH